jgi:hypothetical protein
MKSRLVLSLLLAALGLAVFPAFAADPVPTAPAFRLVVLRSRVERSSAAQPRRRLRGADPRPPRAAVSAHARAARTGAVINASAPARQPAPAIGIAPQRMPRTQSPIADPGVSTARYLTRLRRNRSAEKETLTTDFTDGHGWSVLRSVDIRVIRGCLPSFLSGMKRRTAPEFSFLSVAPGQHASADQARWMRRQRVSRTTIVTA